MNAERPTSTLTEEASAYWAQVKFDETPARVIATAKRFLLDTVAAGIAAAETEEVRIAVNAALGMSGQREAGASIWGRTERVSAVHAALVNGTACHVLELDDYGGCGHTGAVVVPAVLALAAERPVTGKEVLMAILAGYDMGARVMAGIGGYRSHTRRGWHSTGTCGSFAAAAASARLMGLDPDRFAAALGIAGSFTGGIWAFLADGSMTKRLHCGKAAEAGLAAAFLARSGMSGPRAVLEVEWGGFYAAYGGEDACSDITLQGLGGSFGIMQSGMKPYACCRDMHHAIDGLLEILKETDRKPSAISVIRVHGNDQTVRQFARYRIRTMLDAQFSFPYALAVAALSGKAGLDQFVPLRAEEPAVRGLMDLVEVVPDRVLLDGEYPSVEVVFIDGKTLVRDVRHAKGAPQNPLTDDELAAKVHELVSPSLGAVRFKEIMSVNARLEDLDDAREFIELLSKPSGMQAKLQ